LFDPYGIATATPEVAANTLLCLLNQATYLLKRQMQKLEQDFLNEGGFTERLYEARQRRRREKSDSSDKSDRSDPGE
jgi:four helix bundle suffix protein